MTLESENDMTTKTKTTPAKLYVFRAINPTTKKSDYVMAVKTAEEVDAILKSLETWRKNLRVTPKTNARDDKLKLLTTFPLGAYALVAAHGCDCFCLDIKSQEAADRMMASINKEAKVKNLEVIGEFL